jgi:hypothetical protein
VNQKQQFALEDNVLGHEDHSQPNGIAEERDKVLEEVEQGGWL